MVDQVGGMIVHDESVAEELDWMVRVPMLAQS